MFLDVIKDRMNFRKDPDDLNLCWCMADSGVLPVRKKKIYKNIPVVTLICSVSLIYELSVKAENKIVIFSVLFTSGNR